MTEPVRQGVVPSDGGPLVFVADLAAPVLADDDHHHLARSLRLRPGDPLVIADGTGWWRRARFAGAEPELDGAPVAEPEPAFPVGVGFALVKAAKPELAVQKLTELGVDRIAPFTAARSVVRWDAERQAAAHARLVRVAREAAMQSRRARLPQVDAVSTFAALAGEPGACRADRGGVAPSVDWPLVLTGPEGGWDDDERAVDVAVVALSPNVLRAETAAITAGALLTALRAGLVAEA